MRLFIGLSLCDVAGNITVQLNCDLFASQQDAVDAAMAAARDAYPDGQIIGSGGAQVSDEMVERAAYLLRDERLTAVERARLNRLQADSDATGMAAELRVRSAQLRVFA